VIRARWVAPLLLAAALAGCSGDDGDSGDTSGQAQTTPRPAQTGGANGGAPTPTPAPPPTPLVQGKQIADSQGHKITVFPATLKRQGKLALLEIAATNDDPSDRVNLALVLRGGGSSFDEVTLIDPKGGKRYIVARDNEDDCLCTTFSGGGINIQPQETAIVSAYFAAPPAEVASVNVELPAKAGSFIDVPIS
jgi:hypothetical protein